MLANVTKKNGHMLAHALDWNSAQTADDLGRGVRACVTGILCFELLQLGEKPVEISIRKAGDRAAGSVLASDAFFPFADSIQAAAEAGIAAIIQPGGSVRDQEVIDACNHHKIPMVLTGKGHFRH